MSDPYYFAFDTETGDLYPDDGDLLTLYGAIVDKDFKIVDEIDLKLKPNDGRLPLAGPKALETNKIVLADHIVDPATITYKEGAKAIEALAKKYRCKGKYSNIRPMGYNVGFDLRFAFAYLMPGPQWEKLFSYKPVDVMAHVDILRDCGWLPKEVARLVDVNTFFNLPKREAHIAKNDILMTLDVHKELLKLMASKKSGGSTQDLISLLEAE